jgi:hypothetical protein
LLETPTRTNAGEAVAEVQSQYSAVLDWTVMVQYCTVLLQSITLCQLCYGPHGASFSCALAALVRKTVTAATAVAAAGERGPSAGKEWFWLRNNPKLDPSHLLPDFSHFPAGPGSSSGPTYGTWASGGSSSSSRPWVVPGDTWWEGGWRLGAVCLHSWPAHKERLRCFAVDPWERLLVTAGEYH